ncbi:hypothetical protein JTB14_026972 [Gonioctena quinquepunctata]|nr:hypothetical protein JTB14_026972 [Gonioctena quinquepunctata]
MCQLLTLIGDVGMRIFNTFTFFEEEVDKLKPLMIKFEEYFNPKKNLTYQRHKLFKYKRSETESMEQYITELKNLALSCEFGTVKDILICGIQCASSREKLFQGDPDTLEKVVNICAKKGVKIYPVERNFRRSAPKIQPRPGPAVKTSIGARNVGPNMVLVDVPLMERPTFHVEVQTTSQQFADSKRSGGTDGYTPKWVFVTNFPEEKILEVRISLITTIKNLSTLQYTIVLLT